jgi:hypothetical protein
MSLEPMVKVALERLIDNRIKNISGFVKESRSDAAKDILRLREPDDFTLGMLMGLIMGDFETTFRHLEHRELTIEESLEATLIILGKADQMRKAILETTN